MHIKNESLKQYTERIKVIFQRCQHKCEVSLFTEHPTNVVGVALQPHKEDKSGTLGGSSTTTGKGKAGRNLGQDRPIALCLPHTLTLPFLQVCEPLKDVSVPLGVSTALL